MGICVRIPAIHPRFIAIAYASTAAWNGDSDKNQSDTFTYKVTDGQATSSGTVTVGIADKLVWYVDNSKATNSDGRSTSPFNSLTGINGAGGSGDSDGTGDILFLYQGSANYTGGLPLEASQQLIG